MVRLAMFALLAVVLMMLQLENGSAQVTFSRDWNPGKRSGSEIQCGPTVKTATSICHTLLAELRQALACESRPVRSLQPDDNEIILPPIFAGKR